MILIVAIVSLLNVKLLCQPERVEDIILRKLNNSYMNSNEYLMLQEYNKAFIIQNGNNNEARVSQLNSGNSFGVLLQSGELNAVLLNQTGDRNNGLVLQDGNLNYAEMDLLGSDINSAILQSGENNLVKQRLAGEELNYSIMQNGMNNQIVNYQSGIRQQDIQIYQSGVGAKLFISNGNF